MLWLGTLGITRATWSEGMSWLAVSGLYAVISIVLGMAGGSIARDSRLHCAVSRGRGAGSAS